jgi:hypothetical protein
MIVFALVRWPLLCVLSLVAFIFGFRKLARKDLAGSLLLAAGLLMPGYYGAQWLQTKQTAANRVTEIASWPRVKVAAADRPRVLIVRGYGDRLNPFVYFLAETGQFDVYAVNGRDYQPKKIWRMEVGLRDACAKDRTERDEMVVLTGWQSCATAVPAESAPKDGLVLYTGAGVAPHSWTTTRKDYNTEAVWTFELALRTGDTEQLIAYDEFVAFPEMRFHWLAGPYLVPRPSPRHAVASGPNIAVPEPGAFVLSALGIDELTIAPPFALNIEAQRAMVESLSTTSQPDDTRRALDLIAAAPLDPAFRITMKRLASTSATSRNMTVRDGVHWCEKVTRLLRYRDALIEGCANSAIPADKCAQLSFAGEWLRLCADKYRADLAQHRQSGAAGVRCRRQGRPEHESSADAARAGDRDTGAGGSRRTGYRNPESGSAGVRVHGCGFVHRSVDRARRQPDRDCRNRGRPRPFRRT